MQRKKCYQFILIGLLLLDIVVSILYYVWYLDRKIPANINIIENTEESFDFSLPVQCNDVASDTIKVFNNSQHGGKVKVVAGESTGSCKAELKLFGIFHYRNIKFNVVKKQKLIPSGRAAGIYVNAKGVMVLGTSSVVGKGTVTIRLKIFFRLETTFIMLQAKKYLQSMISKKFYRRLEVEISR